MGTIHYGQTASALPVRLKRARAVKGWTQAELAGKLALTTQAVQRWEIGDRRPGLDTFAALCNVLGCSADYLLGATPPIQVPGPADERGAA